MRHPIARLLVAAVMSVTVLLPQMTVTASAANERSLYLYYTHTQETSRIVFKRNGQYVQSGLNELNQFLRDWRRNEPAKMDPRLFDLIWEVYQEVGASQPINIVSAYRSPATNAMLRQSSSGVAENSQHMRGNAMDFFIPGISLSKLRAVAMSKQVGGVGFYPTSGSPFVHLDTGSVRAWPRMTEAQLREIFPDGRTMHLPTNGKPLSQQGYQMAQAEWQRCHSVPCGSTTTRVAQGETGGSGRTLMDIFTGGGNNSQPQQASAPTPAAPAVQVATASTQSAPIPFSRPAALGAAPTTTEVAMADVAPVLPFGTEGSMPLDPSEMVSERMAPVPAIKSQTMLVATAGTPMPAAETAVTALAALGAPMPQPRLLMTNPPEPAPVITAYAPSSNGQQALQAIIDSSTTASVSPAPRTLPSLPPLGAGNMRTAALGGQPAVGALMGFFDSTFGAVADTNDKSPVAGALADFVATQPMGAMRNVDLIAPDLEHVGDMLVAPVVMTSSHFAEITEHDVADFNPTTELGRYVTVMSIGDEPPAMSHTRFVPALPIAVAAN